MALVSWTAFTMLSHRQTSPTSSESYNVCWPLMKISIGTHNASLVVNVLLCLYIVWNKMWRRTVFAANASFPCLMKCFAQVLVVVRANIWGNINCLFPLRVSLCFYLHLHFLSSADCESKQIFLEWDDLFLVCGIFSWWATDAGKASHSCTRSPIFNITERRWSSGSSAMVSETCADECLAASSAGHIGAEGCHFCWLLGCKSSHHGQCQATCTASLSMGLGRDGQHQPSPAGAHCTRHSSARRLHRAEANAVFLPWFLLGPRVPSRHLVTTNAVPTGRAAGFGKLFFGNFYS